MLRRLAAALDRSPWPLGIAAGLIFFFTPHPEWHGDLLVFREAAESLRHPFYARWLFALLALPPEPVAFVLLSLACCAGLYFAVREWGGRPWMLFLSFPYAWTLFYGQIDGLVVGGLALAFWAMRREKHYWTGAGLILASIKPQVALPQMVAVWWWSKSRWKPLVIPAVVVGVSFLRWGFWIPDWFNGLFNTRDLTDLSRNLSWWPWIGPLAAGIFLLVPWLPVDRPRKILALAAATMMGVPYFPLSSAVLWLGMPAPVWAWAAVQLPALTGGLWQDYTVYVALRLLPLLLLGWAAWPVLRRRPAEAAAVR